MVVRCVEVVVWSMRMVIVAVDAYFSFVLSMVVVVDIGGIKSPKNNC